MGKQDYSQFKPDARRVGPRESFGGKVTEYPDGGSSHFIFSYTGYPIVRKIVLPEALQREWAAQCETHEASPEQFRAIFEKYETGRELLNTLKLIPEAKEGNCLGVHIVGLPSGYPIEYSMQALREGMGDTAKGGLEIIGHMPGDLAYQTMHKDTSPLDPDAPPDQTEHLTSDAVILQNRDLKPNEIPTMLATNDEWLWAAARKEKFFRKGEDTSPYAEHLPPLRASVEKKYEWLKKQLSGPVEMGYIPRHAIGGVDFLASHNLFIPHPDFAPPAEPNLSGYVHKLMWSASVDHDYATPIYINPGEALVINNRAMAHGRGDGPEPTNKIRTFRRLVMDHDTLPRTLAPGEQADVSR